MYRTNHAEHFLTRIDRLDTGQAELALGLYRDESLVHFLLQKAQLPEAAERVALSLAEGDGGPYVIVTRKGRFVTCLGEGMHLRDDQPLVSHHTLTRLGGQVQALRDLLDESERGESRRCDQLMMRVLDAGHVVTQREFDDLITWSPFVGHLYVRGLFRALDVLGASYHRLSIKKGLGRQREPLLQGYWKALWASAHFTMLLGDQPEYLTEFFEHLDADDETRNWARTSLVLSLWQTGLLAWGMRGSWLAARLPKIFLKPLKEAYAQTERLSELRAYASAIVAIGHRHRRYRREVMKFIHHPEASPDDVVGRLKKYMGDRFTEGFEPEMGEEVRTFPAVDAADVLGDLIKAVRDAEFTEQIEGLSEQAKISMLLSMPLGLTSRPNDLVRSFLYVPAIAQMDARDFYLPEVHRGVLLTRVYHPRVAKEYLSAALDSEALSKPPPIRAPKTPGRNEPCPCGSGKKYKRCCALARAADG
jgi:hypothetical protein